MDPSDLNRLRMWRSNPGRALVLNGEAGKHGVSLLKFERGVRYRADYSDVSAASRAIASEAIRWQASGHAMRESKPTGKQRSAAKRGARNSHRSR